MGQFLGFGSGSDGDATLSGTDAPIDSSCSGASGGTSLTATNASFAAGQIILIHQSRGTGVGGWEINQIASYVAGTITTSFNLTNTYTDSGASQAQVLVMEQYSSVVISGTLTAKAWNGNVGGITAFLCSGKIIISGTITATGKGYRGGAVAATTGTQGEGTSGAGTTSTAANGNGGGGGAKHDTGKEGGGGGGGNGASGTTGATGADSGGVGGTGGGTSGSADLTTLTFGGGGGAGGSDGGQVGAAGGIGGGIIAIFAKERIISGSVLASGVKGTDSPTADGGGGGGGAGGSILFKDQASILGATLTTSIAGAGGAAGSNGGGAGGAGGVGRIRVEACSITGSTSPSASEVEGGQSWCGGLAAIME